jgi:hypothetical protein
MANVRIQVDGTITEDGKLEVTLPDEHPVGSVRVTIEPVREENAETPTDEIPWEERPWTEEELRESLNFKGLTMGEILASGVVGSGADWDIGDSEEWVQEQRRKEEERRRSGWTEF